MVFIRPGADYVTNEVSASVTDETARANKGVDGEPYNNPS